MRKYTIIDLIRFNKFKNDHPDLTGMEAIRKYNLTYPEISPKDQLLNLSKALGINELHKAITGKDIPQDDELYLAWRELEKDFES